MKKFLLFFCAMLMVFGVVCNAQALPLQDLFDGQSISIGNYVFSDWELTSEDSTQEVDYSLIEVVQLPQLRNPGLRFEGNGQLDTAGENAISFGFEFSVATLDGRPLIEVNWLEITDFFFGGSGGAMGISEYIFDASRNFPPLATKNVFASTFYPIPDRLYDAAAFEPQSQILVEKSIMVEGEGATGLASLVAFEQRFPQVPEPATMLLIGTGLVGLVWLRRKFKA